MVAALAQCVFQRLVLGDVASHPGQPHHLSVGVADRRLRGEIPARFARGAGDLLFVVQQRSAGGDDLLLGPEQLLGALGRRDVEIGLAIEFGRRGKAAELRRHGVRRHEPAVPVLDVEIVRHLPDCCQQQAALVEPLDALHDRIGRRRRGDKTDADHRSQRFLDPRANRLGQQQQQRQRHQCGCQRQDEDDPYVRGAAAEPVVRHQSDCRHDAHAKQRAAQPHAAQRGAIGYCHRQGEDRGEGAAEKGRNGDEAGAQVEEQAARQLARQQHRNDGTGAHQHAERHLPVGPPHSLQQVLRLQPAEHEQAYHGEIGDERLPHGGAGSILISPSFARSGCRLG